MLSTASSRALVLLFGTTGVLFALSSAKDCDPFLFSSVDQDSVAVCGMLYQKFEAALLEPLNVYKLRHVMFPNERAQPLVVTLSYSVSFPENLTQSERCAGAGNDSLITAGKYQRNITWTDSVTLSIIDPVDFDFLQPAVLTLTSPIVRPYYTMNNPNFVALFLDVADPLDCTPSEDQVQDVLEDLTTKAKAYAANTDGSISLDSWDTAYKGFVVDESSSLEFLFVFGPAIALVMILSMIIFPLFYTNWSYFHDLKKNIEEKNGIYYQLYRSAFGIIFVINIVYYLSEVVCLGLLLYFHGENLPEARNVNAIAGRFVGLLLSLFFVIFVAYTMSVWVQIFNVKGNPSILCFAGNRNKRFTVERVHADDLALDYGSTLTRLLWFVCCCCKISRNCRWTNVSQLVNFLAFIVIIAWNLVPTFTLIFVNPVLTLAIVSFVVVFFVFCAIALSLPFILRDKPKRKWRRTRYQWPNGQTAELECGGCKPCADCLTYTCCWDAFWIGVISIVLFLFGTAVVLTIYVMITNKGPSGGGFVGFVVAFIPTIITGVAAWMGKRLIFMKRTESDKDNGGGGLERNDPHSDEDRNKVTASIECPTEDDNPSETTL